MHQINNEKIQELFLNIHNLPVLKTNKLFGQENNNKIKNLILDYEKNNPVGMDSNVKAWSSDYETHQKTDVFSDYLNYILQFSQNAYNKMFSVKKLSTENNELYGSVKPTEISKLIYEKENVEINPSNIQPSKEIKSLGEFKVEINLHSDVQTQITVKVIPQEEIK